MERTPIEEPGRRQLRPLPPQPPLHFAANGEATENLDNPADAGQGAGLRPREVPPEILNAALEVDMQGGDSNAPTVENGRTLATSAIAAPGVHGEEIPTAPSPASETEVAPFLPLQRQTPGLSPQRAYAETDVSSSVNMSGEPVPFYPPLLPGEEVHADGTPNYFNWKDIFPDLELLVEGMSEILEECTQVPNWKAWPEKHYEEGGKQDWKVFPFVHTFPANDESRRTWIDSTCSRCPATTKILRRVPNIRTALFSRLGAGSRISGHRGWADLANHVLRCHLPLKVPEDGPCGLWVNGEVVHHVEGEVVVFDDSKLHRAFNDSSGDRLVLIVDILRPAGVALGTADGGHTPELDSFIDAFR